MILTAADNARSYRPACSCVKVTRVVPAFPVLCACVWFLFLVPPRYTQRHPQDEKHRPRFSLGACQISFAFHIFWRLSPREQTTETQQCSARLQGSNHGCGRALAVYLHHRHHHGSSKMRAYSHLCIFTHVFCSKTLGSCFLVGCQWASAYKTTIVGKKKENETKSHSYSGWLG